MNAAARPYDTVMFRNATDVAQWRMCVGCGACVYACQDKKLSLVDLLDEGLRPVITQSTTAGCGSCTDCVDVCPGVAATHVPRHDSDGLINGLTESWGPVLEIWEGFASDAEMRRGGSSGGLASALALYCIEQGGMAGLVHIASDDQARYTNKSAFSHSRAEILSATGSRYAPASPCDHLQAIEEAGAPCVFVGKPCDVQALRKAQAMRPKLNGNVGAAIGIFCAGTPSTQGTIDLLRQHGVDPAQVEELRYRGRGWPGSFAVRLKGGDGTWKELATYAEAWGFLQKYRPYRCYLCPDGTSEFADISCGDPWYRALAEDEPGQSLVVIRTQRGREIVRAAIAAGYVDLVPVKPELLQLSQRELQYKRGAIWARLLTMQALGVAAPRYQGFSLFRNWLRIPARDQLRSFVGTAKRVFTRRYRLPFRYPWSR
jgi:coenzyme F420 hydrogenase subunit beta